MVLKSQEQGFAIPWLYVIVLVTSLSMVEDGHAYAGFEEGTRQEILGVGQMCISLHCLLLRGLQRV